MSEGRYLDFMARFDGSLRARINKERDQTMEFSVSQKNFLRTLDIPSVITHARMVGAYIQEEAHNTDLVKAYGQRFMVVENPYLMTRDECYDEAVNAIKRSEANANQIDFIAQYVPVLEPFDRVSVNSEDWEIAGLSFDYAGGRMKATYKGRKYVWG
jgi:hypothetical protein